MEVRGGAVVRVRGGVKVREDNKGLRERMSEVWIQI